MDAKEVIKSGSAILGIELGSTRIKASLIAPGGAPLADGSHSWENRLENGIWTYSIKDVLEGVAGCFSSLRESVTREYGCELTALASLGISGMMHGYVAVDSEGDLLVPFRTWRNNMTEEAAATLTERLASPIAQRWSVAHLYQAILAGEEHVTRIARLTTIAGYLHTRLTGRHAMGIDEASGMFPVDPATLTFSAAALDAFEELVRDNELPWRLAEILPTVLAAGEPAGSLTEEGARILDPTGKLSAGTPMCPPEGDAGTGMVATNAVRPRTGNVSAGTSVFAMLVLEKPLSRVHEEIDLVLTPDGSPVAMAHSNNCTSDFDAWMALFAEAASALGHEVSMDELYGRLMPLALKANPAVAGMLAFGYVSGEHITGFTEGRPLFARDPSVPLRLPEFIRLHLMTALGALRSGLDILTGEEGVEVEEIVGHGGYFKTKGVGQRLMAAATKTPVSVMETAGEGGAWGMALLAEFAIRAERSVTLPDFLDGAFAESAKETVAPSPEDVSGFEAFHERYRRGLGVERAAVEALASTIEP